MFMSQKNIIKMIIFSKDSNLSDTDSAKCLLKSQRYILYKNGKTHLTIYVESRRPWIAKTILRKIKASHILFLNFTIKFY